MQEMNILFQSLGTMFQTQFLSLDQSVFDVSTSSLDSDFLNGFHCLQCFLHKLSAVFDRFVAPAFKFKYRIHSQLFACCLPVGLGPSGLSGVTLLLESFVAFGSAEPKDLAIISHKLYPVSGVNCRTAKITLFKPHGSA
eukprot:GHVL01033122.1.p2 GENE.GHVL01033122.1~~GHVL01033122.1.p2  ORF type:complete len:139 (-),score=2.59 GHVL01033122.1:31-447(-)